MRRKHTFLKSNHKKIDYSFLILLVISTIVLGGFFGIHKTYDSSNKSIVLVNTFEYDYSNFWNKFNTFSVVMINLKDTKHLVTQQEIEQFQLKFFNYFGLLENNKRIYWKDSRPVDPDALFCYMKFYKPDLSPEDTKIKSNIINSCPH